MDTSLVMDIAVESLKVTALVGAPVLGAALISGLLVGVLQAATSIQEMTLSFVPKLFVVLGAMALFASYTLSTMTDYFMFIFEEIALKGI